MVGCTSKWDKQCGAYHKQASMWTNASATNLHHLDITKAPTPRVYGTKNPNQSHSPLSSNFFGVKFFIKAYVDHLISSIKQAYTLTEDWTGNLYCGILLDWDYVNRTIDISMLG